MSEDASMPAVLGINTDLSQTPTEDHKALVIRLELDHVEYAAMEDLHEIALASMKTRLASLWELHHAAKKGEKRIPEPFTPRDLERVILAAESDLRKAENLVLKVKRPPPSGVR